MSESTSVRQTTGPFPHLTINQVCGKVALMARAADKLSDQLRAAIDASGRSRYAVCKAIGLDQSVMSRFMAGTSGLAVETIDRLGELLALELVTKNKPAKGKEVKYGKRN